MKCLIVAAGQGARLQDKVALKPLVPLRGTPLIRHVIDRALRAGITEFVVVSGFRGAELRAALDGFAQDGIRITHAINEDWTRANGVSLARAAPYLDAPFLLTMCDHIVDPAILRGLIEGPHVPDCVTLGVDYAIDNPLIDQEDVTRVQCDSGRITGIGKLMDRYNCFDTGVFHCDPVIFEALAEAQAVGNDSISAAMTALAANHRAYGHDIGDHLWMDVDDPAAFAKAEALLDAGRL